MNSQSDFPGSKFIPFRPIMCVHNKYTPVAAVTPSVDKHAQEYNFQNKERGIALIFNHEKFDRKLHLEPRLGTKRDVESLQKTLETKLEFTVHTYNDLTKAEIFDVLNHFSGEIDHRHYDCFVLFCLTHGREGDHLYAFDRDYQATDLWLPFSNNVCLTLANKPKLVFIQASRGTLCDEGVVLTRSSSIEHVRLEKSSTPTIEYTIPKTSDLLVMYATTHGYMAMLDSVEGSPFIQTLCRQLDMNAFNDDLRSILTRVKREVSIRYESIHPGNTDLDCKKCTPEIGDDTLIRKIKFSPKT